jgi:hypothetical protein
MRRTRKVLAVSVAAIMLSALPMAAQDYPPDDVLPSATTSQTTVRPGELINVDGEDWLPGSEVTIEFLSTPVLLGTANVDANGRFSTQVRIPADAVPGPHSLRMSGLGRDGLPRTISIPMTVLGIAAVPPAAAPAAPGRVSAPATAGPGVLATTGGMLALTAVTGLLLLAVGIGTVRVSRRAGKVAS